MNGQLRICRILGVDIGLHYSWLIIAVLLTLMLVAHFEQTNPTWTPPVVWTLAILSGVVFFAALVAHELAHATVARARGMTVRSITLFAFGGVASIEKESPDPKTEFWMAIVGPITSVLIGAVFLLLSLAMGWSFMETPDTPALAMLVWLGTINISLGIFNMVPGFPLDGGRVLRALLWWTTDDVVKATRVAARVGQLVASVFIVVGLLKVIDGSGIGWAWIAFIGWFLFRAAGSSTAQVEATEGLRGVRVGDLMGNDCPAVDSRYNLQTFVAECLLRTGRRCFAVVENGAVVGFITPNEVRKVDRARWPYTMVFDVMRPIDQLRILTPDTLVSEALDALWNDDQHQVPVFSNGRLEGIISRRHVMQFLQVRSELKM